MGFFQNLLQDAAGTLFGSDYLRDYTHASKTFRTNLYEKSPKLKFLYHTEFVINPQNAVSSLNLTNPNFGVLVRDIKLPSFKIDTKEYNQYNRKRIVQSKIKYDPITITFHDDNGNLINKLWAAYYTYYYKDGANPNVVFTGARGNQNDLSLNVPNSAVPITTNNLVDYNERNQYSNSDSFGLTSDWGYYGELPFVESNSSQFIKMPFFKNITVFGFHQKSFIAYTLINPIISSFSHDTYNYEEANGTMRNTMTIEYETVVYNEGSIDGREPSNIIASFGNQNDYDRTLSPIAKPGSNGTIMGQGGLVDSVGGAIEQLGRGDFFGALVTAGTAYNTARNIDLKETAKTELETMLRNSVNNTPNTRNVQYYFPGAFTTPGPAGQAGSPTISAQQNPSSVNQTQYAGNQTSG